MTASKGFIAAAALATACLIWAVPASAESQKQQDQQIAPSASDGGDYGPYGHDTGSALTRTYGGAEPENSWPTATGKNADR
jgi:hypothetical protein